MTGRTVIVAGGIRGIGLALAAAEFVEFGIRVNAIAPGPVDTDMMRGNPQEAIDGMVAETLMKRLATPDEMVGAALLLCSDAGSYVTGTFVIVDGGGTPR